MLRSLYAMLMAATVMMVCQETVEAGNRANRTALRHARTMPWHGPYYHTNFGAPLGLVVPPTAEMQTKMGWGVSQSEMVPIYHQAYRAFPGDDGGPSMIFYPTPNWPSHTDQFGVYYVRGPW